MTLTIGRVLAIRRAQKLETRLFYELNDAKTGTVKTRDGISYGRVQPTRVAQLQAQWEAACKSLYAMATPEERRCVLQAKSKRRGALRARKGR
jgi:hypothetical protein